MENDAFNESREIRRWVGVMWACYAVAIVAYVGLGPLNLVSMCFLGLTGILLIANAVFLIRWQIRYRGIVPIDVDDYNIAKRSWAKSLTLWIVMALLGVVPVLLSIFFPVQH